MPVDKPEILIEHLPLKRIVASVDAVGVLTVSLRDLMDRERTRLPRVQPTDRDRGDARRSAARPIIEAFAGIVDDERVRRCVEQTCNNLTRRLLLLRIGLTHAAQLRPPSADTRKSVLNIGTRLSCEPVSRPVGTPAADRGE